MLKEQTESLLLSASVTTVQILSAGGADKFQGRYKTGFLYMPPCTQWVTTKLDINTTFRQIKLYEAINCKASNETVAMILQADTSIE